MSEHIPPLIHADRDTRNGHYPSAAFYSAAATAENHIVGYCDRSVIQRAWRLGKSGITSATWRYRFRSRPGAAFLRLVAIAGRAPSSAATISAVVTRVGVGSTTTTFASPAYALSTNDEPSSWRITPRTVAITPNALYTVDIVTTNGGNLIAIEAHEVGNSTISEATLYYNTTTHQAGTPILSTTRQRLLEGLSNMYRASGGTVCHWSADDGTATTRTSATAINLIDNATLGAPASTTPGWYLDMSYRCTQSRPTSVPFELAVYGSIGAGSGTVTLVNSAGTVLATVTINGAAGWYTATGLISTTAGKFDLQITGDGVNALSVNAVSFLEWEA